MGDEPILAPMALFRPMALGLIGDHLIQMQARPESDADDPHDEDYLRQTQRQSWVSLTAFILSILLRISLTEVVYVVVICHIL